MANDGQTRRDPVTKAQVAALYAKVRKELKRGRRGFSPPRVTSTPGAASPRRPQPIKGPHGVGSQ